MEAQYGAWTSPVYQYIYDGIVRSNNCAAAHLFMKKPVEYTEKKIQQKIN